MTVCPTFSGSAFYGPFCLLYGLFFLSFINGKKSRSWQPGIRPVLGASPRVTAGPKTRFDSGLSLIVENSILQKLVVFEIWRLLCQDAPGKVRLSPEAQAGQARLIHPEASVLHQNLDLFVLPGGPRRNTKQHTRTSGRQTTPTWEPIQALLFHARAPVIPGSAHYYQS